MQASRSNDETITVGVQYYRPPFPENRFWEEDFRKIKDSGFNTVQLWVLWSWVEATPGVYEFSDYDRLVKLAGENGLGVVLSVIPELQPHWIHRVIPDSELVNCHGHKVQSGNRGECHFGLTPGGCFDNPEVWARMAAFISRVVEQYKGAPHLRGWDIWNELRWNVQADELVCYCPHTMREFRDWLKAKHGDLDGLNRAWARRYASWEDVWPGRAPGRPFTEMIAFQQFITWRCGEHARKRYEIFKRLDGTRPATVHGDSPSFLKGGTRQELALDRGNDWDYADGLDGVGCSSFPLWGLTDAPDFSARIEVLPAAARGKKVWLSEVQGGQAAGGFQSLKPVLARQQQSWLWTGLANGADTVLFWCWRDEVFTTEAGGFGFSGNDGFFPERVEAMRRSADVLSRHDKTIEGFIPEKASVGVLFSPNSYYLYWACEGRASKAQMALQGYGRALLKQHIPYRLVEEQHLDEIEDLKLLFLPRVAVVDQQLASRLEAFVRAGGTLVCEPDTGAFDSRGIFRYPEERFPARLTGRVEVGRRSLDGVSTDVNFNGRNYSLPSAQWLEPIGRKAGEKDGERLVVTAVGKGQVIQLACYSADPYIASDLCGSPEWKGCCGDFEQFVLELTRQAGVVPPVEVRSENYVYIKSGTIGGQRAAFVIHTAPEPVRLRFSGDAARPFNDLVSGHAHTPGADGWLDLECDPLLGVGLLVEQYAEK
jgi:beta-galactosidase